MGRGSSSPSPSVAPTPWFFPTSSSLFLIFVKTWPRPKADGGGQGKRVHAAISGVASPSPSRLPSTRFSRQTQKSHFTNLPLLFSLSSSSSPIVFVVVFLPTGRPILSTSVPARKKLSPLVPLIVGDMYRGLVRVFLSGGDDVALANRKKRRQRKEDMKQPHVEFCSSLELASYDCSHSYFLHFRQIIVLWVSVQGS